MKTQAPFSGAGHPASHIQPFFFGCVLFVPRRALWNSTQGDPQAESFALTTFERAAQWPQSRSLLILFESSYQTLSPSLYCLGVLLKPLFNCLRHDLVPILWVAQLQWTLFKAFRVVALKDLRWGERHPSIRVSDNYPNDIFLMASSHFLHTLTPSRSHGIGSYRSCFEYLHICVSPSGGICSLQYWHLSDWSGKN